MRLIESDGGHINPKVMKAQPIKNDYFDKKKLVRLVSLVQFEDY